MRPHILSAAVLLLALSLPAAAQEEATQFKKTYSIELGTGIQPFYMNSWTAPSSGVKDEYAQKGQCPEGPYSYPVASLTGVMRISRRSEHPPSSRKTPSSALWWRGILRSKRCSFM